jgi:hypothetical protein
LVFACLAALAFGAAAFGGGIEDTKGLTKNAWLLLSPQEIGRLVGESNEKWVAKTWYATVFLGGNLASIYLFAEPKERPSERVPGRSTPHFV